MTMTQNAKVIPAGEGKNNQSEKIGCGGVVCAAIGSASESLIGVNITDIDTMAMPENPIADVIDMPLLAKWFTFILYQAAFVALLVYFVYVQYVQGRTNSFITLDNTSGVCRGDPSSTTCCEVPLTLTGTFLADTSGVWDTEPKFSYIQNNYGITVAGLEYTNAQWAEVMKNITAQLKVIGIKGINRDYAWNLVAWGSFTAQNLERGFLQFYATGEVGIMYDKSYIAVGFASAASEGNQCDLDMSISFNSESATVNIDTVLCDGSSGSCVDNPCPDVTSPEGMGYDYRTTSSNVLSLSLSMEAITTALAVNMGMIELNHLVMVPGDNDRSSLLQSMVDAGYITATQANHTTSYYDNLYAPTKVIYCHSENAPVNDLTHSWLSGPAFCFVRVGNLLTYPVTTSHGWSYSGVDYPSRCSASLIKSVPAANYYCNLMDVAMGLIYYPVPNLDPNAVYTYQPTRRPTQMPTPGAGQPSRPPTHCPTFFPTTKPSLTPTQRPTTRRPTPLPGSPTFNPTHDPTALPTRSVRPTATGRPSLTYKPTSTGKPTISFRPSVSGNPSLTPSAGPSLIPTLSASLTPSVAPSASPSRGPSAVPTLSSVAPSVSAAPSTEAPSLLPTVSPSVKPTAAPSTARPSTLPPSEAPTALPSELPSELPTVVPSDAPSELPTDVPTDAPHVRRVLKAERKRVYNNIKTRMPPTSELTVDEAAAAYWTSDSSRASRAAAGDSHHHQHQHLLTDDFVSNPVQFDDFGSGGGGGGGGGGSTDDFGSGGGGGGGSTDDFGSGGGGTDDFSGGAYYDDYYYYFDDDYYFGGYFYNYYFYYSYQYASQFDDASSASYNAAYSVYEANSEPSDYKPLYPVVIDNGNIFKFAQNAVNQYKIVNNTVADIYVPNIAYNAIIDTIFGTDTPDMNGKLHSYYKDFTALCSSEVDPSVPEGCAVLAFEIYGGNDRSISTYYYQPSSTPAYSNTIYQPVELKKLQHNTPTSLIETYYSCVLAPWPAFYTAVGLGAASVSVWIPLAFAVYMFISVNWLNMFHNAQIPGLKKKEKQEKLEAEQKQAELEQMVEEFKALRKDVLERRFDAPNMRIAAGEGDKETGHGLGRYVGEEPAMELLPVSSHGSV